MSKPLPEKMAEKMAEKMPEKAPERMRVIGLMSGTSMDGIDVALIDTDGENVVVPIGFESVPYDAAFRRELRQALGDAALIKGRGERPGGLGAMEQALTARHAAVVMDFMAARGIGRCDVDLVAFHGQTVLHRPEKQLTVQIGDGALLAKLTGIDVVYDLRAADVAAGGQGAPLAPAYHRAMVAMSAAAGQAQPMAVLNIGGVANVTFIARDGGLVAFDTGPGNALIDDWVFARTGAAFDIDGRYSGAGRVDAGIVAALMSDGYFRRPPPKSLDRNHFLAKHLAALPVEDGAATLAAFTVAAVAAAEGHAPEAPAQWIVTGGGRRNPTLMAGLQERLRGAVVTAEAAGFNGDAVEAEAWAYLGVRAVKGLAITFPGTTGVAREMTGGVVVRA